MPRENGPQNSQDELMQPRSNDRWPRGITCNRGFKLLGTPLGFTGAINPGLLFYSDIDQPPPATGKRILSTPIAALALGASERGMDTLGLEPGRKVRLGRMDIRLLPAGLGPGSALLEVGYKGRSILFCGGIRASQPLHSAPLEIPRCDLLLIDTPCADPRPPSPKYAGRSLANWVLKSREDGVPTVVCGTPNAAVDAAWILNEKEVPVVATRPLYEMLRRLESGGYKYKQLRRLNQDWPEEGVVLHYAHIWPQSSFFDQDRPVAYAGPGRSGQPWASASFRLGEREDRPGLLSFVKETGASQIALGPMCDPATAAALRKLDLDVRHLQKATQMPLPI